MKYLLLIAAALALFLFALIPSYLGPDDLKSCISPQPLGTCQGADAIVAVSGGDTSARTDEAIKLYKAGWASQLIFSGAAADKNSPSNAQAMERQAVSEGVPKGNITIEELSRTTEENAVNTSKFIADRHIKRVVLVTSAYHQRRASLEFSASLGSSVTIVNHPVKTDHQWAGRLWFLTPTGWWLTIGELIKIIAFYGAQGAGSL